MYERSAETLNDTLSTLRERQPNVTDSMESLVGPSSLDSMMATLQRNEIDANVLAKMNGWEYTTLSELNTTSLESCGMFWKKGETWIVLAFRGTDPTEFEEWVQDFQFNGVDMGDWIDGWGQGHAGFARKVFEPRSDGCMSPYWTIRMAILNLSHHLLHDKPEDIKVNVWVTGHSLGAALGSLVFARLIEERWGWEDENIHVRDAYVFGAPVVCDVKSLRAFESSIAGGNLQRTLWRVTNGKDAVSTCVPHIGDTESAMTDSHIPLYFAHLGTEVRLERSGIPSFRTSSVPKGTRKVKLSKIHQNVPVVVSRRRDKIMMSIIDFAQTAPFIGRIVDHSVPSYCLGLQKIRRSSALF